jgi:hypothetical protein
MNAKKRPNTEKMDKAHILTKRWILLSIILVLFLAGVLFYVQHLSDTCLGSESSNYFKLPSSARDIQKHSDDSTRSCTVRIKFQMNSADLEAFLSSTFIKMPLSSTTLPQAIGGLDHLRHQTGWTVNTNVSYFAGEARGEGERYLDEQIIFIDVSSQDQYIVYLVTKKNWL